MKLLTIMTMIASIVAFSSAEANAFDQKMGKIVNDYLSIYELIKKDKTDGVSDLAKKITAEAKELSSSSAPEKLRAHYKKTPDQIRSAATDLSTAVDLKATREAFKELSRPISNWAEMNPQTDLNIFYCSMVKSSWVQKGKDTFNPYYGKDMQSCGELIKHAKKITTICINRDLKEYEFLSNFILTKQRSKR